MSQWWHGSWMVGLLMACGGTPGDSPPVLPGTQPPPCELTSTYFLVDELTLPATNEERLEYGIDIDGDPNGFIDNQLGGVANFVWNRFAVDTTQSTNDAILAQQVLWVVALQTCPEGGDPDFARVTLHIGVEIQEDTVTLAPAEAVPAQGTRDGDLFMTSLGTGSVPVSSLLDVDAAAETVVWVSGMGLVVEVVGSEADLSGSLGIGLPPDSTKDAVAPALARTLTRVVEDDPGCPDACATFEASQVLDEFDSDADGMVSVLEVRQHEVLASLLAPDMDLATVVPEMGEVYWPNRDDVRDHLSLNLGLHASPITVSW